MTDHELEEKIAKLEELIASIKKDLAAQRDGTSDKALSVDNHEESHAEPVIPAREVDLSESKKGEVAIDTTEHAGKLDKKPLQVARISDAKSRGGDNLNSNETPVALKSEVSLPNKQTSSEQSDEKPASEAEPSGGTTKENESVVEAVELGPPIGEVGTFDGEFVIMPNGKKYQVPPNYASKSQLVIGDKLKLLSAGDKNEFKLIEQVDRKQLEGILTKKDYIWTALVGDMNFKLISAAVRYYGGDIGDKVLILVPTDYIDSRPDWAALVGVEKANVDKGGFSGSASASEIETKKKMRYVKKNNNVETEREVEMSTENVRSTEISNVTEEGSVDDVSGRTADIKNADLDDIPHLR